MRDRTFLIRQVVEERASDILAFHKKWPSEYLWPRSLDEFEKLAFRECLLEALETTGSKNELVGVCYVMRATELDGTTPRDEFGGIFVTEDCRGHGVATTLGIIAICNQLAWDPPKGRLIAHVHEANPDPRRVLQDHLGFVQVGEEIPPVEPPASMARNKDGKVVGHLFEFQRRTLVKFADWLKRFDGSVVCKRGTVGFEIALPLVTAQRNEAIEALRDLAAK